MNTLFPSVLILLMGANIAALDIGTRNPNIFSINGENVRISDQLLKNLRAKWTGEKNIHVTVSDSLNSSDVRWILDYIAISEVINSKGCNELKFIKARDFEQSIDSHTEPKKIVPGLFDYVWEIQVCDESHNYRIVHTEETGDFAVYPIKF